MAAYPKNTIAPADLPDIDLMPDSALLRLPPILALCQCGRSTWFMWMNQGHAPQPVRIGPRAVAWRVGDIRAFMAGRERGPAPAYTVKGGKASQAARAAKRAELI